MEQHDKIEGITFGSTLMVLSNSKLIEFSSYWHLLPKVSSYFPIIFCGWYNTLWNLSTLRFKCHHWLYCKLIKIIFLIFCWYLWHRLSDIVHFPSIFVFQIEIGSICALSVGLLLLSLVVYCWKKNKKYFFLFLFFFSFFTQYKA